MSFRKIGFAVLTGFAFLTSFHIAAAAAHEWDGSYRQVDYDHDSDYHHSDDSYSRHDRWGWYDRWGHYHRYDRDGSRS